jgi:peroxiredoxin
MTWQDGRASIAAAVVLVGILGALLAGNGPEDSHHHSDAASVETPREGAELIGTQAPGWETAEWLNAEPVRLRDLRGKLVLVRWWTDTCPFCRRSAPALNEFHERYVARGLVLIGMYHPKPIHRPITADLVRDAAEERGFRFAIAIDRDWSILRRWWLNGRRRLATSVSFLIDKRGVIRYVHPGPVFHREVLHGDDRPRADFLELQGMIEKLLAEPK